MGSYLSQPVTEKHSESGSNDVISYAASAMQGWRMTMEDAHVLKPLFDGKTSVFGVFDGHGGKEVALFCEKHLISVLQETEKFKQGDFEGALQATFLKLDEMMTTPQGRAEMNRLAKDEGEAEAEADDSFEDKKTSKPSRAPPFPAELVQEGQEGQEGQNGAEAEGNEEGDSTSEETIASTDDSPLKRKRSGIDEDPKEKSLKPNDNEEEEESNPILNAEASFISGPGYQSGSTAVVALIHQDKLIVANAGDSRCVLSRNKKALDMSEDHQPQLATELARIKKAGGYVSGGRVNGNLNLSRALGDLQYKRNKTLSPGEQVISGMPELRSVTLTPEDRFVVLACDGIWNSMTSEEVVEFVNGRLDEGAKPETICEELLDKCLSPHRDRDGTGCDNMTALIIVLNSSNSGSSGSNGKLTSEEAV